MPSGKKGKGKTDPLWEVEVMDLPFSGSPKTGFELQQVLEKVARHQRETLALLDAARAVMTHEHFAEAAREIFDRCREVIGAPSGYISLSNESGTENEVVFLESGGLPCTVDPDLPMPIRGLRAESYKSGKVVYDNNFSTSDHVKFLPAGHVILENVLFAPLKTQAQQTVGLLGLANKTGGFTEYDARLAAGFAEIAAIALVSKRAGEDLEEARAHLESKVKQRTEELLQSNVQLKKEIRDRQEIEAELRQSEHQLRVLTSQLLSAQEQERQRISRELHDELGQSLMVLKLQIRNLAEQGARDSCFEVIRQLDGVIENVRRLSRDLSPTILEDLGLTVALQNLFDTFSKHYGIKDLTYHSDEIENLFPREYQVNIYRIFQEALTNIGKHARASKVTLTVKRGVGEVCFSAEDNGVGCDLEEALGKDVREKGMGLAAMAERVRILGGSLHIKSEKGRGTSISFRMPVAS